MRRSACLALLARSEKTVSSSTRRGSPWSGAEIDDLTVAEMVVVIPRVRDSLVLRPVATKKPRTGHHSNEQRAR